MSQNTRCAIYTRKSIMYRRDEEYGSIESQRDVCAAYIKSQRHRGWRELALRYDDLGHSGGTLERPALNRLLRDIESGLVDVVVLYKIDRLTRSLRDFMRLLDVFERNDIGFVSITQSFDTRDSLGRLVLNILLTFAQFEREMLADRIRDKHRAMRAKGLWTGGRPPIGYDLVNGEMRINPIEAKTIQEIFARFLKVRVFNRLAKDLAQEGFTNKPRLLKNGKYIAATPITCGTIHAILRNPIYVNGWPTSPNPETIISPEIWAAAQEVSAERARFKIKVDRSPNVLLGILFDSYGRRMSIHDFFHKRTHYRYYLSTDENWARTQRVRRFRVKADEIEETVLTFLRCVLEDREQLRSLLITAGVHGLQLDKAMRRGPEKANELGATSRQLRGKIFEAVFAQIELSRDDVKMVVRPLQIERLLLHRGTKAFRQDHKFDEQNEPTALLRLEVTLTRVERNFHIPATEHCDGDNRNPSLISLIADARRARSLLENEYKSMVEIGRMLHRSDKSVSRLVRLTYLAPDITIAILDGRQPADLTRRKLYSTNFPTDWAMQRKLFGFPPQGPLQMGERRY